MDIEFGLIGSKLSQSFSKDIHGLIGGYRYDLIETDEKGMENILNEKKFRGLNVTIPYKKAVIPFLGRVESNAMKIGAVNTIVNEGGVLTGYNTDFDGLSALLEKTGIDVKGAKALILGTGGTSNTAAAVLDSMGAEKIIKVSREKKEGSITYAEAASGHTDADIILNASPCGMYPDITGMPISLDCFKNLRGVIDVIYNPVRSRLVMEAVEKGIKAAGGLYMLVGQAVKASEKFTGNSCRQDLTDELYNIVLSRKENIVLTGMPGSGKSTVGKILSRITGRKFIDTDTEIEYEYGLKIPDIFARYGEEEFRKLEKEIIRKVSGNSGCIIATGGGAVLNPENIKMLRLNGKIFFIDRPLNSLIPTEDRPTANSREAVEKRYNERFDIYRVTADITVDASAAAEKVAEEILRGIKL